MVEVYYFYLCCYEVFNKFFVGIVIGVNFCYCMQDGVRIKYQICMVGCKFYFVGFMVMVFEQFF